MFQVWESNQGNQYSNGNQKNVIQGQRPDRETKKEYQIIKIIRTKQLKQINNSDSIKNLEYGPGEPVNYIIYISIYMIYQ